MAARAVDPKHMVFWITVFIVDSDRTGLFLRYETNGFESLPKNPANRHFVPIPCYEVSHSVKRQLVGFSGGQKYSSADFQPAVSRNSIPPRPETSAGRVVYPARGQLQNQTT